ncbi:MAG TPA: cupin domain-containing protein, partial [Miltoncostaeaceae bacterium]|nr:cupin domain-containing protein [Miltoncostaeaceae bacterium]
SPSVRRAPSDRVARRTEGDVGGAVIREPGEAERLALGPTAVGFLVTADDTGGAFALPEATLAPGVPGPVLHRDARMHDVFVVLEGVVRFRVGDEERDLGAGGVVVVPPGVAHTFANPHTEPARFLNMFLPGGLEGYLREAVAAGAADPGRMAEIAARYDFEALPGGAP